MQAADGMASALRSRMGSTRKVKKKPEQTSSVAGDRALERETRADLVFSPRQTALDARNVGKNVQKHAVKRTR